MPPMSLKCAQDWAKATISSTEKHRTGEDLVRRTRYIPEKILVLNPVSRLMPFLKMLASVIALAAVVSFPSITIAQENYAASEFIEENIQNQMASADIVALLNQTVGNVTGSNRAIGQPLRQGLL